MTEAEGQSILILRLEGPLQSWGVSSKFRIRQTQSDPSFSGVTGMLCAALGRPRSAPLNDFQAMRMGVRADREGTLLRDYHTTGAGYGVMSAQRKVKKTESTQEPEVALSDRYYLSDASFLVALKGPRGLVDECADALQRPRYPLFLGRKACPPATPPYVDLIEANELRAALLAYPWPRRHNREAPPPFLRLVLPADPASGDAEPRSDMPVSFARREFHVRYVQVETVDFSAITADPPVAAPAYTPPSRGAAHVSYTSKGWERIRRQRLAHDGYRCVFTGLPADEVHHITYQRANAERIEDLRSLSKLCHDAVTMLEAERGMYTQRIDPMPDDPALRQTEAYQALAKTIRQKMDAILEDRVIAEEVRARRRALPTRED